MSHTAILDLPIEWSSVFGRRVSVVTAAIKTAVEHATGSSK
jgi:hypothetical protein